MNARTEADAVAEVATKNLEAKLFKFSTPWDEDELVECVLVPKGFEVLDTKPMLDARRSEPERRRGTAELGDLASFVAHVKRFADDDSIVFATPAPSPKLVAVLDYHRAGATASPRFGGHRSVYTFPVSEEWQTWSVVHGVARQQEPFAALIEERVLDLADPQSAGESAKAMVALLGCSFASPAKLLELSRGLSLRVNTRVAKAVNLSSGESQLQYATEHADDSGQPLKVPGAFLLAIPVFKGGSLYQIPARLRYRVSSGTISWTVDLYRLEQVLEHAFGEACELVRKETGLPLLVGSPER